MTINKSKSRMTPDGLIDTYGPVTHYLQNHIVPNPTRTGLNRCGFGYPVEEVRARVVAYKWAYSTEGGFMNIIEELKSNYDEAEKLWNSYDDKLKKFRHQVKNDVSSLESSARKTTNAVQRMHTAYGGVIELINSEEMRQATENAERLAAAMTALAGVESHKMTFAVVDESPE